MASTTNTDRRELLYGLEGIHLDAYDAVIRPYQVFAVRTYTLRRWASILGATGFWLLVALQQQCYRNPKGADWCVISRPDLAEAAGVSEATVHRYLHGDEHDQSLLCHWIQVPDPTVVRQRPRRWSAKAGKMVQPPNRYGVVMDAPLAPVDQRGLAQFLLEYGVDPGTPAAQAKSPLEYLAGLSLVDLLDLCDELAYRFAPPPSWDDEEGFYPTVADVVIALGVELPAGEKERGEFLGLCSRVQQAFVGQTYLGTQYFLREWLPVLGHKLALVVVQLRSRCFWDAEERRDTVTMNFTHLAEVCGCSARWLRQINATNAESRLFFLVDSAGRGKPPVFQVSLLEPVAPQDRERYQRLLKNGTGEAENGTGELLIVEATGDSAGENGSGETEKGTDELLRSEPAERSLGENGTGETGNGTDELLNRDSLQENRTDELLETERVDCSPGKNGTDELLRTEPVNTQNGTGEQHVNTIITLSNTSSGKGLKKQHLRARVRAPAALALLLADFGIGSPTDRRILARQPDEDDVRAWMLYTLTQKGLGDPDIACGYVINRLLNGDCPPPRFKDWAWLSASQWQDLWRALEYGGAYVAALPVDLARRLEAWGDDFFDAFPDGPFGDGVVDRDVVCDVIAEIGGDSTCFAVTVYDDAIYLQPEDEVAGGWLEERSGRLREALTKRGVLHRLAVLDPAKTESTEVEGIWREVLAELQLEMTRTAFDTWLRDSRLIEFADGRCIVEVRNGYARDWLQHRLLPVVERTLKNVVGQAVAVEFVSPQEERNCPNLSFS